MGENDTISEISDKHTVNKRKAPSTAWKPGQSGNPNGRPPKGLALTDVMRQMLEEKPEIKKALMSKLFEMALQGDLPAIREVLDRIEGRPLQKGEMQVTQLPTPILDHVRSNHSDEEAT